MSRSLALILSLLLLAGGTTWWLANKNIAADLGVPEDATTTKPRPKRSELLAKVRRSCKIEDLDRFVAEQRDLAKKSESATDYRVLAEALYERMLAREQTKGFKIGEFVSSESFETNKSDIEEGLAAIDRARSDLQEDSELDRLDAGFHSYRLTDFTSVMKYQGRIDEKLKHAFEKDPKNGHVHVALGCRLVFVPKWLGQSLDKGIEHFEFAAKAQPLNERPQVFAAFARYLQGKRKKCIEWLRMAAERNPNNRYIAAVLRRLEAGEKDAFERDLDAGK